MSSLHELMEELMPLLYTMCAAVAVWFLWTTLAPTMTRLLPNKQPSLEPAVAFFKEMTAGRSVGHDKRLFSMLHPSVLAVVERGALRAVLRCVVEQYGTFQSLATTNARIVADDKCVQYTGDAYFSKRPKTPIPVSLSWTVRNRQEFFKRQQRLEEMNKQNSSISKDKNKGAELLRSDDTRDDWLVVAFNVEAPPNEMLDIMSHVHGDDFAVFGEKFVLSLLSRSPVYALSVMHESLASKYSDATALAAKVAPVISSAGGLREQSCTLVSSQTVGGALKLDYVAEGAKRNMEVEIRIVLVGLQCFVTKYNIVLAAPREQHMLFDSDTQNLIPTS